MVKNKVTPQIINDDENDKQLEELRMSKMTDDELDDYFEKLNAPIIDGVFDPQALIGSAVLWYRRKLADFTTRERMRKSPKFNPTGKFFSKFKAEKKFILSDSNAKKLVELWCSKNCRATDIDNFLKNNPVDSTQYLIAILVHIEEVGVLKGIKATNVKKAKKAAFTKSEKSPQGKAMKKIKKDWEKWRKNPSQFRFKSHFATAMLTRYPDVVSKKNIEDKCRQWESESLFEK